MRVLVVDDSAFMRKAISQMLASDPEIEVVGTARDGQDAIEKANQLRPHVITLDIEMPVMDGLTALRELRRLSFEPRPAVVMCSTLTSAGSHEALKALRMGAADVIGKDPTAFGAGTASVKSELITKVKAVGEAIAKLDKSVPPAVGMAPVFLPNLATKSAQKPAPPTNLPKALSLAGKQIDLVVIGSSTGGPPILEQILVSLPADFPAPVVVAQHMPALFTKSMAERLDQMCAVSVVLAEAGMPVKAGCVYISPGGQHGRVRKSPTSAAPNAMIMDVSIEPASALYKPSVNELFASAAAVAGARAVGVMLTGMGEDGMIGAKLLHAAGGTNIAQEASTCVVYGMPRAVVDAGVAHAALTPQEIVKALASIAGQTKAPPGSVALSPDNFKAA